MAIMQFNFPVDMRSLNGGFQPGAYLHHEAPDRYAITSGLLDQFDTFYGSGLGETSHNMPFAGTVTGWQVVYFIPGDEFDDYVTAWDLSGLAVPAATFSTYFLNGDFGNLMSRYLIAGDDVIIGSNASDWLIGGSGNDNLTGGGGDDVLHGGSGADEMFGDAGDDIYYADNGGDRAIETSAAGGIDTVRSSASFELGNHIENLQLTGAGVINGAGNGLDNRISGNNQVNVLNGLAGNDVLRGNGGNDALYGGTGDDRIDGGSGEDWIEGGAGRDVMTGGLDADLFVFRTGDFDGLGDAACDRILDFSHLQGDQIRLNSIDANSANGSSTNEAFTFIGNAGFNNVAGELRYQQSNGNTYVYGDTNGDGVADFMIRLDGIHGLAASDFLL